MVVWGVEAEALATGPRRQRDPRPNQPTPFPENLGRRHRHLEQ